MERVWEGQVKERETAKEQQVVLQLLEVAPLCKKEQAVKNTP